MKRHIRIPFAHVAASSILWDKKSFKKTKASVISEWMVMVVLVPAVMLLLGVVLLVRS